jgi:UDP-N-acetylglucosamine 1-carboxyvinyltransferase
MAMEKLGATLDVDNGYVFASAKKGLVGNRIVFPKVSVGATHCTLMAATLAKGETLIDTAQNLEAMKPDIIVLRNSCLRDQ